jgi:hypothetical protein
MKLPSYEITIKKLPTRKVDSKCPINENQKLFLRRRVPDKPEYLLELAITDSQNTE